MEKPNIILIGMPGSGKSTVGKVLSQINQSRFIDTDILIKESEGRELKDIVNKDGLQKFLNIQERVISELDVKEAVIATGGSVIYSELSMNHLKENGLVVYLKNDLEILIKRAGANRRFARKKGQSLKDIFEERKPLYEKYSDITIDCCGDEPENIALEIINRIIK